MKRKQWQVYWWYLEECLHRANMHFVINIFDLLASTLCLSMEKQTAAMSLGYFQNVAQKYSHL